MKQHLSVLMLAARSTIYKVIGIVALMSVTEGALFYLALQRTQNGELYGFEQMITKSRISLVCAACFLLLCVVLSLNGCELLGSKLRYTIQRLSISERSTAIWWAVYYIVCFFIFWSIQLLITLLLCRFYVAQADPASVSGQTIFLAFYRNKFLHSLLPLAETSRYIRNAILVLCLGITASCFSYRLRHDQKGVAIVMLAALTVVSFPAAMGSLGSDVIVSLITLIITAGAAVSACEEIHYERAV